MKKKTMPLSPKSLTEPDLPYPEKSISLSSKKMINMMQHYPIG
tara:strand:+ start:304 stop:432 length:129 start_codon:yes stop_codon:yes gene_type:complete